MRTAKVVSCSLLVAGWLCGVDSALPQSTSAAGRFDAKPNIVILFADDLGYGDLGSYGHPSIRTPQLDTLAREGLRWTNFYAMDSLCSASRGTLLTGRLSVRTGLYGRRRGVLFPGSEGGLPDEEFTLAEALKTAGYDTMAIGKWHLGDKPDYYPTRHGFDEWLGLPYSNDLDWAGPGGDSDRGAVLVESRLEHPDYRKWNVPLIRSARTNGGFTDEIIERPVDQTTLTQRYTAAATDFIRRHASGEKPFLLYVPYTMPHVPLFASPGFRNRSLRGVYGDTVEEIDWSVGEIRRTLESERLSGRTLVIFTSDNGPWTPLMGRNAGSTGPLSGGKSSTWEGGVREPAIFWWPGVIPPRTTHEIGTVMDIYATALALAGVTVPSDTVIDGVDLTPIMRNSGPGPRTTVPYYASGELRAFRQGQYKIHFITAGPGNTAPRVEHDPPLLYDLGVDPAEKFNLAEEQPDVLRALISSARGFNGAFEKAQPIFDLGLPEQAD